MIDKKFENKPFKEVLESVSERVKKLDGGILFDEYANLSSDRKSELEQRKLLLKMQLNEEEERRRREEWVGQVALAEQRIRQELEREIAAARRYQITPTLPPWARTPLMVSTELERRQALLNQVESTQSDPFTFNMPKVATGTPTGKKKAPVPEPVVGKKRFIDPEAL